MIFSSKAFLVLSMAIGLGFLSAAQAGTVVCTQGVPDGKFEFRCTGAGTTTGTNDKGYFVGACENCWGTTSWSDVTVNYEKGKVIDVTANMATIHNSKKGNEIVKTFTSTAKGTGSVSSVSRSIKVTVAGTFASQEFGVGSYPVSAEISLGATANGQPTLSFNGNAGGYPMPRTCVIK